MYKRQTYTWDIAANSSSSIEGASASTAASATIPGSELTLVAGTTSPQDLIYRVTPFSADECEGEVFTVTITVNPVPQLEDSLENAICHNDSYTYSPVNGEDGVVPSGVTYSWAVPASTSPEVSGTSGTDQNEFSTGILSNLLSTPETLTYLVTPKILATGCEGEDFTVTITVNPEPQIDNFSETICEGDTFISITPEDGTNGVVPLGTTYTLSLIHI